MLLGAVITFPIGRIHISLGTSVGTLLAGLIVGWARSTRPWFAQIPDAAILFMRSIGLAAFVAMIGLKAGPIFISAVKESGYLLFLGGIFVTTIPLLSGILFGHYVLRLDSVQLLGGVAGAQTMIAGVAAVQEKSDSPIATLRILIHRCDRSHPANNLGHHHCCLAGVRSSGLDVIRINEKARKGTVATVSPVTHRFVVIFQSHGSF